MEHALCFQSILSAWNILSLSQAKSSLLPTMKIIYHDAGYIIPKYLQVVALAEKICTKLPQFTPYLKENIAKAQLQHGHLYH